MCGIAGAIVIRPESTWVGVDLARQVGAMGNAIAHRGPDDQGTWTGVDGRVILGHRRLSIVDLSDRGHQPMRYADRYVIVFNGEIYNHQTLREELATSGCKFQSTTDTEVIVAAACEWGIEEAIRRCVGMFALALWDSKERALYLARDRMGEKPLFVGVENGCLFFSSELRALETVDAFQSAISGVAASLFLRYGYVPSPFSLRQKVVKLPQASLLRVPLSGAENLAISNETGALKNLGAAKITNYWVLPERRTAIRSESQTLDELEHLVGRSIAEQLQCDVPVGVFLSGGIDSTVVASVAKARSASRISTFTVKFDTPGFDESEHAALIAAHLGSAHQEISIREDELLQVIPEQASKLDEPTGNASYFPLRLMAEKARESVKVVLSGDGGDELFGGYNRYKLTPDLWRRFQVLPQGLRHLMARTLKKVPDALWRMGLRGANLSGQAQVGVEADKICRFLAARSLGEAYLELTYCWPEPEDILQVGSVPARKLDCDLSDFLSAVTALDIRTYLADDNLAKSDRATMAVGLEQRAPLLDYRIAEFSRTIPDELLVSAGATKVILRKLAYRHIPQQLLDRPKMGFTVPLHQWLMGPLRKWADELFHDKSVVERAGMQRSQVLGLWLGFKNGERVSAWRLWSLAMLLSWLSSRKNASIL